MASLRMPARAPWRLGRALEWTTLRLAIRERPIACRTARARLRKGEIAMKRLPFLPIAWTLAFFAAVVFAFDNLAGALFPNWWVMQKAWELLLPGFAFGTWGGFFIGLVESFAGGFLTAVLFVPIWNFFTARQETQVTHEMKPAPQHHG